MSSEALERALYLLANPASSRWGHLVEILRDARTALAEVARLEQERDEAREKRWETVNKTLAALAVARKREQRLHEQIENVVERFDELLNAQWVEGYSAAEVERLAEFRDRVLLPARAALVDEPAAAGAGHDLCACGSTLMVCCKCGDSRCLACDPYDERDTCGAADPAAATSSAWSAGSDFASAAADEPGEAPQVRRGVGRIVGHRERPPMVVGDDEARGGVSPSGKERP